LLVGVVLVQGGNGVLVARGAAEEMAAVGGVSNSVVFAPALGRDCVVAAPASSQMLIAWWGDAGPRSWM
jgi:hypothetical protein